MGSSYAGTVNTLDLLANLGERDARGLPSPLVYGAIGDAYGFGLEFAAADFVAAHNDLRYIGNAYWRSPPGRYSDDTQMQLALAELMTERADWSPLALADAFVSAFKRDPRPGYAKRFYAFLQTIENGRQFLDQMQGASERNGAAMRAPVIGLLPDIDDVMARAASQARLTHDTPGGVDSAIAAALISHYLAYDLGPKAGLPDFLAERLPEQDWHSPWEGEVPCHGIKTIQAVLSALLRHDDMAGLLQACVAYTGDVDSVATIALAAASGARAFARNLPEQLWLGLENGPYGLDYLLAAEDRLLAATGFAA